MNDIITAANRCLKCRMPFCSKGCPINTPIKEVIALLLKGEVDLAGEMLFDNNPLSVVCCRVCPVEEQCEMACVLNKMKKGSVEISRIEGYLSDYYLDNYHPKKSLNDRGKIAIIGSGPAGITIATTLAKKNFDVTIYEKYDKIGGVMRYGIPEFRLPKIILDKLERIILEMGIKIKPNTTIGTNITVDDLMRDDFRTVFLGVGVWKPMQLKVKGETNGNVHYAIDYLKNPDVYHLGKRVAIIGAGNVAMDVARTAFLHGAKEVFIICNKGENTITARKRELDEAVEAGTEILFYKSSIEFRENGIILGDSKIEVDENGKEFVSIVKGSEELFPVDSIIVSISQGPRDTIVSSTKGIEVKDNGLVAVDRIGHTTKKGVFASGDVVTGAKTVVAAAAISKLVADAIEKYMDTDVWPVNLE